MRALPKGIAKERAMVAGSFDPVTVGHLSLIKEASCHFEEVYAVIFVNEEKNYMFTLEERLALLTEACKDFPNVKVDFDNGMQYIYADKKGITVAVRGYRNEEDYEYEREIADFNIQHNPYFDTLLLPCKEELQNVSSTSIRKAIKKGEIPKKLVPEGTEKLLIKYLENRRK